MRVLFTSLRNSSHFLPLIPFIDACRRRGHEVGVAAPAEFAKRAADASAAFFPFGHPGDERLGPLWKSLHDASPAEVNRISVGEIFAGVCAGSAIPALLETVDAWRPSVVVRESQEYAAVVAAARREIPQLRVAISAPSGEVSIYQNAVPYLDAHLRAAGLPPDPTGARLAGETALTLFPASLELPATGAPVHRYRALRGEAPPLPDWWGGRQGPFVYVTMGTVVGGFEMMRSAYRTILDALVDLPARVLLTIGGDLAIEALGEVPAHVHVERFVPQDAVIPHAAAVVCHGGSGTMLGAAAAGVPLVVTPMFADQPFNAERAVAAGSALSLPTRELAAAPLRQALARVLAEPSFRTAAQRIAAEIAALPSIDDAAVAIERMARS